MKARELRGNLRTERGRYLPRDLAQHDQIGVVDTYSPRHCDSAGRRLPALVTHRVMTGVAIEQRELGEQTITTTHWIGKNSHLRLHRHGLRNCP